MSIMSDFYGRLIGIRNVISNVINRFRRTTDWEPSVPQCIDDLRVFARSVYKWVPDYVFGLMDNIQSIGNMNWQLNNRGTIEGDCDDFSLYTCYMLYRMGYRRSYMVNILPMRHVVAVFADRDGRYNLFSNTVYYGLASDSADSAVHEYAAAQNIQLNSWEYVFEDPVKHFGRNVMKDIGSCINEVSSIKEVSK